MLASNHFCRVTVLDGRPDTEQWLTHLVGISVRPASTGSEPSRQLQDDNVRFQTISTSFHPKWKKRSSMECPF